jgi:F420-dependent methylenetetrahydromethanopterin dehydrogenase
LNQNPQLALLLCFPLLPARAYNTPMPDSKLVVVQSCGSRLEAELARGALEEAGIPAMIQGDTAGGMREHLAWSGAGFKVLVREDDATAARELLTAPAEGDEIQATDSDTDDDSFPP